MLAEQLETTPYADLQGCVAQSAVQPDILASNIEKMAEDFVVVVDANA